MYNTVPNQRTIAVHRERAATNFLGIKNENWQGAARDLGAHALMLYLYLASNADGFQLALSPAAIRQAVGMPASTYRDQFIKLVDKGYLVQRGESHIYDFFETPQHATQSKRKDTACADGVTAVVLDSMQGVENAPTQDIEINRKFQEQIEHFIE